jgi:hypothetical protein
MKERVTYMMANSQLKDNEILEIKSRIVKKKQSLKTIQFKYSSTARTLYVDALGINDIIHDSEYYDNVEDHLMFAELSWLTPMTHHINKILEVNFEAMLQVLPDGSMSHENIHFEVNAGMYSKQTEKHQILNSARMLFTSLLPFRQYIKDVTFKGNQYTLKNIHFTLDLDGKKVNTILKDKQVINQQIMGQWLATLDNVLDYNADNYKFVVSMPVVNGKMRGESMESTACFRFENRGDKR